MSKDLFRTTCPTTVRGSDATRKFIKNLRKLTQYCKQTAERDPVFDLKHI